MAHLALFDAVSGYPPSRHRPQGAAYSRVSRRGVIMLAAGTIVALAAPRVLADDAVSQEAKDAVTRMGKSLASGGFSFQAATIREYQKDNLPLHIFHASEVTVRRPDHLRIDINGNDGRSEIGYDGKTLIVYNLQAKRYATMQITGSVEAMLRTASERMGLEFPLADLLADEPGRSFLDGVVMGAKVGEVTVAMDRYAVTSSLCSHCRRPDRLSHDEWAQRVPLHRHNQHLVNHRSAGPNSTPPRC